jgi:hypothetical protein
VEAGVVQQTHPYALQAGEAFEKRQNMRIMMIEMKMRIKIGGNRENRKHTNLQRREDDAEPQRESRSVEGKRKS